MKRCGYDRERLSGYAMLMLCLLERVGARESIGRRLESKLSRTGAYRNANADSDFWGVICVVKDILLRDIY